jgi:hypothetical protein
MHRSYFPFIVYHLIVLFSQFPLIAFLHQRALLLNPEISILISCCDNSLITRWLITDSAVSDICAKMAQLLDCCVNNVKRLCALFRAHALMDLEMGELVLFNRIMGEKSESEPSETDCDTSVRFLSETEAESVSQ